MAAVRASGLVAMALLACTAQAPPGPRVDDTDEHVASTPLHWRRVSAAYETCGITLEDDIPACWGSADYITDESKWPADASEISPGAFFACAVRVDGTLACWGLDTRDNGYDPVVLSPPDGTFVEVTAGLLHACAIRDDGSLTCWGPSGDAILAPPSAGPYHDVECVDDFCCALDDASHPVCWGNDVTRSSNLDVPFPDPSDEFVGLGRGLTASICGWRNSGAYCWGDFAFGGQNEAYPPDESFQDVGLGNGFGCGLLADGSITCWGLEYTDHSDDWEITNVGQLDAPAGTGYTALAVGWSHSCALDTEGIMHCWGSNEDGESTPPTTTEP